MTATLTQLPGSRPMAHDPGLTWCSEHDEAAAIPVLTSRVNRSQRMTPTPLNKERAIGTPLKTELRRRFSLIKKGLIEKIFFNDPIKASLERLESGTL